MRAGETFTPEADGWFLSDIRYRAYRRAVADRILEVQTEMKKEE